MQLEVIPTNLYSMNSNSTAEHDNAIITPTSSTNKSKLSEDFDLVEEICDATNTKTTNRENEQELSILTFSSTTTRMMTMRYRNAKIEKSEQCDQRLGNLHEIDGSSIVLLPTEIININKSI